MLRWRRNLGFYVPLSVTRQADSTDCVRSTASASSGPAGPQKCCASLDPNCLLALRPSWWPQARIDRPVDKRRASHPLQLPRFLPKGASGCSDIDETIDSRNARVSILAEVRMNDYPREALIEA
jgi:hypothetical protein